MPKRSAEDRFWEKVDKQASGCWVWTASKSLGYGKFSMGGQLRNAHRVAYEWARGQIPAGLHLDHLCRNRSCVNPDHLEAVTQGENIRRGEKAQRMHCPAGHPYDVTNTYHRKDKVGRMCRACTNARTKAIKARRRQALESV